VCMHVCYLIIVSSNFLTLTSSGTSILNFIFVKNTNLKTYLQQGACFVHSIHVHTMVVIQSTISAVICGLFVFSEKAGIFFSCMFQESDLNCHSFGIQNVFS
jgi:hypothetical protein